MYIERQEDLYENQYAGKDIEKLIFGPSIKNIPENCFNGCNNLKEIIFEGNIDNIEAAAFMNCNNLKIINANSINIIKDFAFYNCNQIIDFDIEENVANNIKYGINNNILSEYFLLPKIGTPINNIPWYKIDLISRKGKARNYFNIGDEKELIIGEYNYLDYDWLYKEKVIRKHPKTTYHVQILGFNHDNLSDGTGKVGITVGLKEIMTTTHTMNYTQTNVGGWKDSEIRAYLNKDLYNALPKNVRNIIKSVNKLTSKGKKSQKFIKTSDKIFLLSEVEIYGRTEWSVKQLFKKYEGNQYQYYIDGGSQHKSNINAEYTCWWERSPIYCNNEGFCCVDPEWNGYPSNTQANVSNGIVFAFCI